MQGFGFLATYRSLRVGESPLKTEEVDYNLGRGFQQLGGRNPHEIELMLNTHTCIGLHAFAQKHYLAVLESTENRRHTDSHAPVSYLCLL